jgi:hypothetical protein
MMALKSVTWASSIDGDWLYGTGVWKDATELGRLSMQGQENVPSRTAILSADDYELEYIRSRISKVTVI